MVAESGESGDAWKRLEEVLVRWPGSEAAHTALKTRFELEAADEPASAYRSEHKLAQFRAGNFSFY
jgi:hypothetical protein